MKNDVIKKQICAWMAFLMLGFSIYALYKILLQCSKLNHIKAIKVLSDLSL